MRILLAVLITAMPLQSLHAETIYLRDRTHIKGKVTEAEDSFDIVRYGHVYSVLYTHDTINKSEVFAVIGDNGDLLYPRNPNAIALSDTSMTQQQLQILLLRNSIQQQKRMAGSLNGIFAVMFVGVLAGVVGVVIAGAHSQK